jgi:3-dehydroquinate synthase
MPETLTLRHPSGSTPVLVGEDALVSAVAAAGRLAEWLSGRTAFLVTTPRVLGLHGHRLEPLRREASRWAVLEVEEGEPAKTVASAERLWSAMLAAGGKRDSRVLAFGGGSVGDLAGFAAGCFLRGVEFAQIPTTLLAQVDAAIGGKTGVDLPGGKNTVGVFHHPAFVVCDTSVLPTLPRAELRSGLVEVIKMAALLDPALLGRVEERLDSLLSGDPAELGPVAAAAAAAKIAVVERDPVEQGDRKLLNFGHTLGHAIETAGSYTGLRHGEAVAYGILFAGRLAVRQGFGYALAERLRSLLARLGLPPLPELDAGGLISLMARDKKARESGLSWVLPAGLGDGRVVDGVAMETVREELSPFLREPFAGL